jgi:hypothetical protein
MILKTGFGENLTNRAKMYSRGGRISAPPPKSTIFQMAVSQEPINISTSCIFNSFHHTVQHIYVLEQNLPKRFSAI